MKDIYLLKDLSIETGYSTHTLKYYLKMGLLKEIGISPSTRFRFFNKNAIIRLKKIRQLKSTGMTIKQIQEVLDSQT